MSNPFDGSPGVQALRDQHLRRPCSGHMAPFGGMVSTGGPHWRDAQSKWLFTE